MNQLRAFNNETFGFIRVIDKDGEPWFVGKDVAEILGYSNPRKALIDHVDEDDKGVTKCDTRGGAQEFTVINESGLYSLVLQSKLPKAKEFKKWITSDVLPSIRKHGAYLTPEKIEEVLLNPDTIIKICTQLKEEQAKRRGAEAKLEEAKPAQVFAAAVSASPKSILVRGLASFLKQNGIDIGQNRLFKWLRENGYLIKTGSDKNMPTQKAMELGLFEVKEGTYINGSGENILTRTVRVSGNGQIYFVNKFLAA